MHNSVKHNRLLKRFTKYQVKNFIICFLHDFHRFCSFRPCFSNQLFLIRVKKCEGKICLHFTIPKPCLQLGYIWVWFG